MPTGDRQPPLFALSASLYALYMTVSPTTLALRYLGGCPGHTRSEPVQVAVYADRFELQARGWGWRIGFDAVSEVGDAQPAPDGAGQLVPVVWTPPGDSARTLMLSGAEARRLRFLLAQAVASARLAAEQPPELPPPARTVPPGRRPPGPWQRELRRMRTLTVAAMGAALVALVLVLGIAFVVVGRDGGGHWPADRALVAQRSADTSNAAARGDTAAVSQALQALTDECQRLQQYNGEAANTGADFEETQRLCAEAGIVLF